MMFKYTVDNSELLTEFMEMFSKYLNKSYKFTMHNIANPLYSDYKDNERLILIALNKSVYQNMYSFLRLTESNMQYAAFSCLEHSVNAARLYYVLYTTPKYMHDYISTVNFSLEEAEKEIAEKDAEYKNDENYEEKEDFSLKEFSENLRRFNTFRLKSPAISSQLINQNVYLGLGCGKDEVSDELQHEVRKNIAGAYTALSKHNKLFFNGGADEELEQLEDELYSKFMEYVKAFV